MTKAQEEDGIESTWNRTAYDEPVFILCGRDELTPGAIRDWAKRAKRAHVPKAKIDEALAQASLIESWQKRAPQRVKRPD